MIPENKVRHAWQGQTPTAYSYEVEDLKIFQMSGLWASIKEENQVENRTGQKREAVCTADSIAGAVGAILVP